MGHKIAKVLENMDNKVCSATLWYNDETDDFSVNLSRFRPKTGSWFNIKNILPDELEIYSALLLKLHDYLETNWACTCGGRRIFKKEEDYDNPELERLFYFKCKSCGDEVNLPINTNFLYERERRFRDELRELSPMLHLFYKRAVDYFKRYRYPNKISIIMKKNECSYIDFQDLGKVFLHEEVPENYENSLWCLKTGDESETGEILKTHALYKVLRETYKRKHICSGCGEVLVGLPIKPWYNDPKKYVRKCELCGQIEE